MRGLARAELRRLHAHPAKRATTAIPIAFVGQARQFDVYEGKGRATPSRGGLKE